MSVRIEPNAEPIPGYTLIERIGGGGFGEVWKANAPGGLLKAIKFVAGDLSAFGENNQRAEQELKALRRIKDVRHPYILSLERIETDTDGQLIIVMELAERNLSDRFRECRSQGLAGIPRDELLRFMEEAAEALDLMNNTYQLQHLDVKPANLFIMFNHVKVADFGLVKYLEGAQASVTGGLTPVYAAPETFDGMVTRFSDQYSLAIVYQELLTGCRPFNGTSIRQLIVQHMRDEPNVSSLPPADQLVIQRALSKVPERRFPTCAEMVRRLRSNSQPEIDVEPKAKPQPSTRLSRDNPNLQASDLETPSALLETGLIRSRPGLVVDPDKVTPTPGAAEGLSTPTPERVANVTVTVGDGVLFPALVLGIGQVSLNVLQALRGRLHERFGPLGRLPNVRLLQIDTDPDVVRSATRGSSGTALSGTEVLLTELNRPSHYVKPRTGRVPFDKWLNPRMLYRIPRSQVTTGIRALGRLAFCDNYRVIARRLKAELKAAADLAALTKVGSDTGLGVRTNRPRVYVVANLAGGTAGMFIDLAYTARAQLRRLGFEQPEVVGLFFLPPTDCTRLRTLALGNAYAALKELEHFAKPGVNFKAHYHDDESALDDADPPFDRCSLLPLPDETDEPAGRQLTEVVSQVLYRDLCSPLGRKLDEVRAAATSQATGTSAQRYQTFGLYHLVWPRRTLLQQAGRRICHRLVQHWLSKDSKPIREQVHDWVQERWQQDELAADTFIGRVRQAAEDALGGPSDTAFQNVLAPLNQRCLPQEPVNRRQKRAPAPELKATEVREALAQLLLLVGKPEDDHTSDEPATFVRALRDAALALVKEWEQKLAEIPVKLIESPAFRLAGAEEAIRQVTAMIEQALQHHEPLAKELTTKAAEAYHRLKAIATAPPGSRAASLGTPEILELLRNYPKWRFQSIVLQQLANAFLRLRGYLSDDLREVNFCRVRLKELQGLFEAPPAAVQASEAAAVPKAGRCLFPSGCKDLQEALEQFLACLTPERYQEADIRIQAAIKREYRALVTICLTPANNLKKVEALMLETAEAFAGEQLAPIEVTEMYLGQFDDDRTAANDLAGCFQEAKPLFAPSNRTLTDEFHVLAAPPGPAREQLQALLPLAQPKDTVYTAETDDDVVMYREFPVLCLADLKQFGTVAQDAYRLMSGTENFTPHTRIDVQFE